MAGVGGQWDAKANVLVHHRIRLRWVVHHPLSLPTLTSETAVNASASMHAVYRGTSLIRNRTPLRAAIGP